MKHETKIVVGAGLVSLDILMRGYEEPISYKVGGTCGNVLMILAHLGWDSYPVARLNESEQSRKILADMRLNHVHNDFVSTLNDGATPIIIQHNYLDKNGNPAHKFTFQSNRGSLHLDYKPVLKKTVMKILDELQFVPSVFFFDRVSAAILAMAKHFKSCGSLVFFEPSSKAKATDFDKAVTYSDIIKFAEQRLPDVRFTETYSNKLFIQTQGSKGLRFNLFGKGWQALPPVQNKNIVDTSGAGDWTTAAFLNEMTKAGLTSVKSLTKRRVRQFLSTAQEKASQSCSYEGARGMMQGNYKV